MWQLLKQVWKDSVPFRVLVIVTIVGLGLGLATARRQPLRPDAAESVSQPDLLGKIRSRIPGQGGLPQRATGTVENALEKANKAIDFGGRAMDAGGRILDRSGVPRRRRRREETNP